MLPLSLSLISAVLYGTPWLLHLHAITPMHFINAHVCVSALLRTRAVKLISSDCLITQWVQRGKQEVLVAMAQRECYVLTNSAQWHLAKSVVTVWTARRMCRRACVCPHLCNFSCPLNASLPPSICLLTDGRLTLHSGLMGDKLQRPHKALSSLTRSSSSDVFKTALDLYTHKYYYSEEEKINLSQIKCNTFLAWRRVVIDAKPVVRP